MSEEALWSCPRCGRSFRTRNQWHSCVVQSIDAQFEGTAPAIRATFDRLVAEVERFGPVRVDAVKTGINLAARAHFAGARPQRQGLRVAFLLRRRVHSGRIVSVEPLSPPWVAHAVKLRGPDEVDAELLDWLREAYELKR